MFGKLAKKIETAMWQQQTGYEDQYREVVVSSLNTLIEKIGYDSANESMAALSAVGLLSDQDARFYRRLADYYYSNQNWIGSIVNFNECCVLNPVDFNAMFYLASAYKNLGCFAEAIDVYNKSLEIHEYPEAMLNLALTYSEIGEKELERPILERLTSAFPNFTLGYYNLGIYWYGKRDLEKSIQCYRNALKINAEHGETKIALALALLMDKQYIEGFEMYDSRWGVWPNCPVRNFNRPYWHGQRIGDESSILVSLEQGFGDSLMMLRYLPQLLLKFSRVAIEVQPVMQRLVAKAYPQVEVVVHGSHLPDTDWYCPVMSLPRAFASVIQPILRSERYLHIGDDKSHLIDLDDEPRIKVGICWKCGGHDPRTAHRSLSLHSIKGVFNNDEYTWVSLAKDAVPEEINAIASPEKLINPMNLVSDFYDTYQLINALDVIVTVDTAIAHLAGAMGKPTIVILNEGHDWKWGVNDETSAWYPHTRLFRAYELEDKNDIDQKLLETIHKALN